MCGEEKGLLGSKYFAAHSTVPAKSIVADINTDMFLPLTPLKLLTVYGLQESDLGEIVREVAESQGVKVQRDPEPQRNAFIRSDQYSFIRHGIPSLAMKVGFEPGSPDAKLYKDWLTQRYHAPSDDTNQPVDLQSAAAFEAIVRGLMIGDRQSHGAPAMEIRQLLPAIRTIRLSEEMVTRERIYGLRAAPGADQNGIRAFSQHNGTHRRGTRS